MHPRCRPRAPCRVDGVAALRERVACTRRRARPTSAGASNEPLTTSSATSATSASGWSGNVVGEVVEDLAPVGLGRRDQRAHRPRAVRLAAGHGGERRCRGGRRLRRGGRGRGDGDGGRCGRDRGAVAAGDGAPATTAASARVAAGRVVTGRIERHRSPEGEDPRRPSERGSSTGAGLPRVRCARSVGRPSRTAAAGVFRMAPGRGTVGGAPPRRSGDHGQDPEDQHRDRAMARLPGRSDLEGDEPARVERGIGDHAHQTREGPVPVASVRRRFRVWRFPLARIEHLFYICARPPETCRVAVPPTPSSTATATSRSSTAPRRPTTSSRGRSSSGLPALGDHRPPGPVRRGPVLDRGRGRRAAPGHRGRDRAARRRPCRTRRGSSCPARRAWRPGRRPPVREEPPLDHARAGRQRPRPERARLPGHREVAKEDHRGVGERAARARTSCCSRATRPAGGACAGSCRGRTSPGRKAVPAFTHELLEANHEGRRRAVRLPRRRARAAAAGRRSRGGPGARRAVRGAVRDAASRRPDVGLRARAAAPPPARRRLARLGDRAPGRRAGAAGGGDQRRPLRAPGGPRAPGRADGDPPRPVAGRARATCGGRTASRTSRARRSCWRCRPATRRPPAPTRCSRARWREGIAASAEIAAGCRVELAFERYRFPGFPVPKGETPFSHLSELCWEGARRRYHPLTPAVVEQLAHELEVIEQDRAGRVLPDLLGPDAVREVATGSRPRGGGARRTRSWPTCSGITRVDPIRHELLFERFINEGRTAYPDVDIDFSSERREEVIQYVYERYGAEHTGMVCNLVTYRARSAVREVGLRAGVPAAARGPGGEGARDVRLA